jgi:hypothetical protein
MTVRARTAVRLAAVAALCLTAAPAQGRGAPTGYLAHADHVVHGHGVSAQWVSGDGFNLWHDTGLLPDGYTIRLVDSPGVELLRVDVEDAAAEFTGETGIPVTVAPGVVADRAPVDGEILVGVSTTNVAMCADALWRGCTQSNVGYGGPNAGVLYQLSADVEIRPHALTDLYGRRHVVFHELGHAFGLTHYNAVFEGRLQVMTQRGEEPTSYRSGDRNGFRYQRDRGA